ncbi:MAG: hypothetical protein KF716_23035 [Anaerolineae bacterium]|nr:hypothetical protein [Anaerolineae bacterium]
MPKAQSETTLTLLQTVTGEITAAAPTQTWTFEASSGQIVSAWLQPISGDLQPVIELLDPAGTVLASSRPASYRSVAIDAYPITSAGTYSLRVSPRADSATSGGYKLALLPGYSFLLVNDPMLPDSALRSWREPASTSRLNEGRLRMGAEADNLIAWTTADKLGTYADVYVQVDARVEEFNAYWEYGILLRTQRTDNDANANYYAFSVNSSNQWRVFLQTGSQRRAISDWADSPVPIASSGTLAVLAQGSKFTLFFNGQAVGSVEDASLPQAGLVGLMVGTSTRPNHRVIVGFDNFIVTVPATARAEIVPPQTLNDWQGTPEAILGELIRAAVLPAYGTPAVEVNSAFVSNSTPSSLLFVKLMEGSSFANLVYAADVLWDSDIENIACALEFRVQDGDNFSIVYFDRKGGLGVRQTVGGEVKVNDYALTDALKLENRARNRLLVVAYGNGLLVYVNGQLAAETNLTQVTGEVLLAAYNYQLATSYCGFTNIWLRSFN